jgi:D-serine deaminase-like pyridoxal phosphate-dependent protein
MTSLPLSTLETPVPLVDLDRLERNLDRVAAYAGQHGLSLRPHTKTHKSPRIASEQLRRGAVGVTCATVREAEVMSEVTSDVLVAYPPVGAPKLRRLMALPRQVKLTVALDSAIAVEQLAAAARAEGRAVGVYVELDMGMRRVGVGSPDDAVALARLVAESAPLEYVGIAFYPGHIREHMEQQASALARLTSDLHEVIDTLERAGLPPRVVSGGSTPTMWRTHEIQGVTEFRPGTYVYNDRTTAAIGACAWEDCALTVLATVVSTAVPDQAVIDAGTKALGREPLRGGSGEGFGALLDRPDVVVRTMSEEHGILDLSTTDWRPRVGDQVRIVPNHVCIVVHLNDVVHGVRGEKVETSWAVAARGRQAVASGS